MSSSSVCIDPQLRSPPTPVRFPLLARSPHSRAPWTRFALNGRICHCCGFVTPDSTGPSCDRDEQDQQSQTVRGLAANLQFTVSFPPRDEEEESWTGHRVSIKGLD